MQHRNNRIISFSGRKESGKTELASICEEYGYEKKSFATELKKLVCKLTGIESIVKLNAYKNEPIGQILDNYKIQILQNETGFEKEYISSKAKNITLESTARDWLQVIGTDIIREIDPDWHVRKTLENLDNNKKYVFDDTRFKNELEALNHLGAECWFIIRTKTDNISNHQSENSLSYKDFKYNIIVNNLELDEFRKRWKSYIEYHETTEYIRKWLMSLLFVNPHAHLEDYNMNKVFVYREFTEFKNGYKIPENIIENELHNGFTEDKGNPFLMEEMKRYYNRET